MANEVVNWRPNPKQAEFLQIKDDIFEVFYGGALGGGKSEVLTLFPLLREFYKVQRFKGLIVRRTFPELESEILIRAHEYYPLTGARWDGDNKTYIWDAYNSRVRFGHLEHETSKQKYNSAEYQFFGPDELTSLSQTQYEHIAFQRMRSIIGIPPLVRAASAPGDVGHEWVRKRFIEPCREGRKVIVSKKGGQKRLYLPALLSDNIDLMREDPDYASRLELSTEAEKRAKLYGDWWTFTGQVFGIFRPEHFEGEPEWATHVYDPRGQELPYSWPRFLATDIGLAAMNYSLWAAVDPSGDIWIYREFDSEQDRLEQWARTIGRLSFNENLQRWALDHTLFEGEGEKIISRVKRASGLPVPVMKAVKGRSSRYLGLVKLQQYLYWDADKGRHPKLHISKECKKLINTIPLCVYKEDRTGQINDVAQFPNDDPYDCVRYLLDICDSHIINFTEDVNAVHYSANLENLKRSEDWTSYFVMKHSRGHNQKPSMSRRSRYYSSRV